MSLCYQVPRCLTADDGGTGDRLAITFPCHVVGSMAESRSRAEHVETDCGWVEGTRDVARFSAVSAHCFGGGNFLTWVSIYLTQRHLARRILSARSGDLCNVVFPRLARKGLLAMLSAYFDESETQNSTRHHFLISGYVSDEKCWRQFERKWNHALVCDGFRKHGIHWTDLAGGRGDFEHLTNTKDRIRLQQKYLSIIKASRLQGLASSFDMEHLAIAVPSVRKLGSTATLYQLAYSYAFESVLNRLCRHLRNHGLLEANEKIAFIFDQNKQVQNKMAESFLRLKTEGRVSFARHLGTITFADDAEILPLQAADVLANELQREMRRDPAMPPRWQLERLREENQVAHFPFTRHMFESLAGKIEQAISRDPSLLSPSHN